MLSFYPDFAEPISTLQSGCKVSNKLKETTVRKYRCTAVAAGSIHKLTQWYYIGNEQEMEKKQVASCSSIICGIWL